MIHILFIFVRCPFLFGSINEAYDRFQFNSMHEQQLSPTLNSIAIVSPRNSTNGVECETDDRGNCTSIESKIARITNASDSVIQIDDSDYDEVVIEAVETESTDDTTAVKNGGPPNTSVYGKERGMIATQNKSDAHNSNDG